MKFLVRTASGQTRTILARAMSLLLLVGLVQAVTFGSAHSHLNARSALDAGPANTVSGLAEQAVPDPFHFQNVRQECLVCLFHQQLFSSVVHTQFLIANPVTRGLRDRADKLLDRSNSFLSTPMARPSGRAPPRG